MLDFLPMPHTVTVHRASESGELDDWGEPIVSTESITHRANVKYNSNLSTISVASGQEIVYTATINITGAVEITFEDDVTWADSRGRMFTKKPIDIFDRHDLSGNIVGVKVVV